MAFVALTSPLFAQLSGSYTIDPSGTGTNNYTSFTSAISALSTSGVSGAVTFNVKQGTYTEQVTIPAVTGASATNKITFQADPTNTSAATVTYSPTGTADNWTVRLNGCNDVTIKGLTITTGGTTYGRLVDHTGNVTNISLLDNTFNGVAGTSTSSYFAGIYYTSPSEAKGVWHVEGNTMNNISYGVYVYGSSYTTSMDSIFIENNVINTSYYGLYSTLCQIPESAWKYRECSGHLCIQLFVLPLVWCGCSKQYHELRYGLWFLYLYLCSNWVFSVLNC